MIALWLLVTLRAASGILRRDVHDGAYAQVASAVEGVFAVEAAIHVSNEGMWIEGDRLAYLGANVGVA